MTSLLMVSSLTKSPGIVKNLFLLKLAPRTKIFKSWNAWGFAIECSSDDWMHIREVKDHCELANVIWSFPCIWYSGTIMRKHFECNQRPIFPLCHCFCHFVCLFKVNSRNTRTSWEVCSRLIVKTPDQHHWRCSCIFIVNFEQMPYLVLVFLLVTLSR